jgi:nucleoside-diphosphate-sugar epimerase
MARILITGARGFVGRRLLTRLAPRHQIQQWDLAPAEGAPNYQSCDVSDADQVNRALGDQHFDIVIHCAGLAHDDAGRFSAEDFLRVNAGGTTNLVAALKAKPPQLFVLFSSVTVYGEYGRLEPIAETAELRPATPYAHSKVEAEAACFAQPEVPAVALRLASLYGPDFQRNVRKRVSPIRPGFRLLAGRGEHRFSFCSIENVGDLMAHLVDHPDRFAHQKINVTDGQPYRAHELMACMQKVAGRRICLRVPRGILRLGAGIAARLRPAKAELIRSLYWKLAENNIYANQALLQTGFSPQWDLHKTFARVNL